MNTDKQFSSARMLITEIIERDFNPDDNNFYFNYDGRSFNVSSSALKDIALILASEYNLSNGKELLKVDRDQLLRSQLFHLAQEAIRLVDESKDPKYLRSLTQIYKDLKVTNTPFSPDLETFFRCMQEFKPAISRDECIALVKKHSVEEE